MMMRFYATVFAVSITLILSMRVSSAFQAVVVPSLRPRPAAAATTTDGTIRSRKSEDATTFPHHLRLRERSQAAAGDREGTSSSTSSSEAAATTTTAKSTSSTLQELLKEEFPAFYSLLSMNDDIWKTMAEKETNGCTIFAPSDAAFENLGEKKLLQLKDVRNAETAKKMGLYHVVATEAVTAAQLRTEDWTGPKPKIDGSPRPIKVQALVTMAGEVPVGRSKSGGLFFFGRSIGAKEDGDVVIGTDNARIVKSYKVGKSFVHEVDALISPVLLWRYCDQLRIPGF
jgi:uncharacterized surface protein with fasciclin (FAS1) repeats